MNDLLFIQAHEEVHKYVKSIILNKYLPLGIDDIVNDGYLILIESGETVNTINWKSKCRSSLNKNRNEGGYISNEILEKDQTKFCKYCKEDKPISCFGLTERNKGQKQILQAYCNECMTDKMAKHRKTSKYKEVMKIYLASEENKARLKKYRHTENGKEKNKKYQKNFRDKHNDKWKSYLKERYKNHKEQLTDVYIKSLLKTKYSPSYIALHPNLIQEKRDKILTKRGNKKMNSLISEISNN